MKLQGHVESSMKSKDGHSQVRMSMPSFGQVIFSAPKDALAELLAIPDDAVVTITVEFQPAAAA